MRRRVSLGELDDGVGHGEASVRVAWGSVRRRTLEAEEAQQDADLKRPVTTSAQKVRRSLQRKQAGLSNRPTRAEDAMLRSLLIALSANRIRF